MSLAEKYFYEELLKISIRYANSFMLKLKKEFAEKTKKTFSKSKSEYNLDSNNLDDVTMKPIRKNYSFTM